MTDWTRIVRKSALIVALWIGSSITALPLFADPLELPEANPIDEQVSVVTDGGHDHGAIVIPPWLRLFGKSYGEWGAEWWRWAMSIPFGSNPILDETGASCSVEQSGPVWFLAGSSGSVVTRSCTIPFGKVIFFPVLNYLADYPCPPEFGFEPAPGQDLDEFLTQSAKDIIDQVDQLSVEIDGKAVSDPFRYRGASGPITFTGDPSLSAWDPCVTGTEQNAASDGYWIMLPPLRRGQHTIRFTGGVSAFGFSLDVTYNINVVSRFEWHTAAVPLGGGGSSGTTAVGTSLKKAASGANPTESSAAAPATTWGGLKLRYR